MPDPLEKFTDGARRALARAQDEARRMNHREIDTEHQLLGVIRAGEGMGFAELGAGERVVPEVLVHVGVLPVQLRTAVEAEVVPGTESVEGAAGLSGRAKRVIEGAVDEARSLGHDHIGSEHLLLGLLRVEDGVACGVLNRLGVTLENARAALLCVEARRPQSGALHRLPAVPLWASAEGGVKRYNLALPESLYQQVQQVAARQQATVVEVLRRFIKLGLLATEVSETPGSALVIREAGREREIVLL